MPVKGSPFVARSTGLQNREAMSQVPESSHEHLRADHRAVPENGQTMAAPPPPVRKKEPRHKGINTGLHHSFFGGRIVLGESEVDFLKCTRRWASFCRYNRYASSCHELSDEVAKRHSMILQVLTGRVYWAQLQ